MTGVPAGLFATAADGIAGAGLAGAALVWPAFAGVSGGTDTSGAAVTGACTSGCAVGCVERQNQNPAAAAVRSPTTDTTSTIGLPGFFAGGGAGAAAPGPRLAPAAPAEGAGTAVGPGTGAMPFGGVPAAVTTCEGTTCVSAADNSASASPGAT